MSAQPQGSEAAHWGLAGTIVLGALAGLAFVFVQTLVAAHYINYSHPNLSREDLKAVLAALKLDGTALSLATISGALICVPLVATMAWLKPGARLRDYFAIRAVSGRTLASWLALALLFAVILDAVAVAFGRPVVSPFVKSTYASARSLWLLCVAFVVAAPLFEEVFFRGFLFRGFEASLKPAGAIVATSAAWAAIHLQYDGYDRASIFFAGLILGAARAKTRSLLPPLAMHAFNNAYSVAEAALAGQFFAA